ncbi:class I SAM-dependent methyltransferase [Dichotomicrobium thermohalophilum]|uniref:Methyltransferase family protein n=1 Tax=Dichotomicrobium thermohalophilum TaxID=933063 RepID=A0A397Q0M8_9HYPH|nr:class I SAM-dependent methyltransferase [Dichotomicrobium thermohalophilum]RIA55060.1 methyltransferase family protein [Dichotomicrobium thermohalophilum]
MSVQTFTPPAFDQARAEAFAGKIAEALDTAAVMGMMAIGHRLGLFDTLAEMPPATSEQIAQKTGLAERYIREWLAVMTCGRVVEYDPARRTYHLPPEHAACLTRGAPLGNLAVYSRLTSLIGAVQDDVVKCFETGGGTTYGDYPCFHEIMAEDSQQTVISSLFDAVLPAFEGVDQRLAAGIDVLDAGCGRGEALLAMSQRFPASRFVGYDLCPDAIAHAQEKARDAGAENVHYEVRDLTGYCEPNRWDLIFSFDAVHDQKDPQGLINGLAGSLRPGGVYVMQDIGGSAHLENNMEFPMAAMLYAISCAHCTPISVGQGGQGLGTMWGWETAEAMLRAAGFQSIEQHRFEHDPTNVWFLSRV